MPTLSLGQVHTYPRPRPRPSPYLDPALTLIAARAGGCLGRHQGRHQLPPQERRGRMPTRTLGSARPHPPPRLDPRPSFQCFRLAAPVPRCWALTLALALALTLSLSLTQVWATSSHRCTPSSTPTSYHPSSLRTCANPNPNPGNPATPTLTPTLTPNLTPTLTLATDPGH